VVRNTMPQREFDKLHPHPVEAAKRRALASAAGVTVGHAADTPHVPPGLPFAELAACSNFSFLEGASHPEELVERAKALGLSAIAVCDRHTMAGVVRAHVAAKEHGMPLVVGTRASFALAHGGVGTGSSGVHAPHDPTHVELALLAECREGYARLCRLLTLGKRRAGWTGDLADSADALDAGIETADAARDASACHLWMHDLLDAGVQSLGHGEPGEWSGRAPESDRPLAPHALPGVHALVLPPPGYGAMSERFLEALRWLRTVFDGDRLSLGLVRHHAPDDAMRLLQLEWLSQETGIPLAATNAPHMHDRARQPLHDALTAVRARMPIDRLRAAMEAEPFEVARGRPPLAVRLAGHDERHLKPAAALDAALAAVPPDVRAAAIARTAAIARRCARFTLDELRYRYPAEVVPAGRTPMEHLRALVEEGAAVRWPAAQGGVPAKVRAQLEHELAIIADLDYPCYFLTVHAIVAFARGRGILCQGRGAAANSAVCFCLGITAVDPARSDMLFERFISRERSEPPDIDVDFEHERREEVIQHVYATYGRGRAALCAEVVSYRGRSAIRDVGFALGLPPDTVAALAGGLDWWNEGLGVEGVRAGPADPRIERARDLGLDPADPAIRRLFALAGELRGFPRHLSQHVGGFVITDGPLCELVPVRNATMDDRTIIEWDKDDIEAMGMLKVDLLALGMLTAIRKAIDLGNAHPAPGWPAGLEYRTVPAEDPAVYGMVSRADTVGVFQIESRAQMSMLPRLRPRCFYDLVIEVAIVRPGPIQGDMVHPYLRRRNGEEPAAYPNEDIRRVLGKTLGVPLFQEQAMSLAVVAAGFTPGQADELRRAIAAWKRKGNQIARFGAMLVDGMETRGYSRTFAEQVFRQIQGFSGYGFPESHAASFALLVYVSAWLKRHHPAAFTAALLNSQPMGFYAPAQLVRDAREHGVDVRPVCVLRSAWDCTLEDDAGEGRPGGPGHGAPAAASAPALRLGMRMVHGLRERDARAVADAVRAARGGRPFVPGACPPFATVEALWRAAGMGAPALRRLAAADAFAGMGIPRQQALWQVRALRDAGAPVLDEAASAGATLFDMAPQPLPVVPALRQVAQDYAVTGLSLKDHPLRFVRPSLERRGAIPCAALPQATGSAAVGGLVLCRQRPSTASGIVFMTIEDETGPANLILRPKVYERFRRAARHAAAVLAEGRVESRSGVTHLLVRRVIDLGDVFAADGASVAPPARNFR
jgi:error-prone DNA polymerase